MAEETTNTGSDGPFSVMLITPRGTIADERTDAVTAPGKTGEFKLLPGHLPFLTALRPGVLALGGEEARAVYAVGAGYLRVDHDGNVEILVEECVAGGEVDVDGARTEVAETREELDLWDRELDADFQRIQYRYELASAQIEANQRARAS